MNDLKRFTAVFLILCFMVAFSSCAEDSPQEVTKSESTTQNTVDETNKEIAVLSLEKEYICHYEWYGDYPEMLVRSEYTDVTLDGASGKEYPLLAKALSETSVMRRRAMDEEKDNFIVDATQEFLNNSESFSTYVSTLDVQVRRADSVALSVLEDYATESYRSFNSLNYDTESGALLALSDVVKDIEKLPAIVEKEVTSRMWQGEFNGETAIPEYFKNTPEDDLTWVLDYNGITFYFNPGGIAPTNFGIQTATVTFAQYPDLFNEKYIAVPDAYIVGLPVSSSFFTDITGDNKAEELIVSGNYDPDGRFYYTLGVYSDSSDYEVDWFSYDLNPHYVKTADGDSFLYVFSDGDEVEDRKMTLIVFSLKNGEIKQVSEMNMGMLYKGDNVFAVPTDPENLLLSNNGTTDSVFSASKNGIPMKTVSGNSAE